MTTDAKSDLAALRALAEEGRYTPLAGGRFLVFFGLAVPIANLSFWALERVPDWQERFLVPALIGVSIAISVLGQVIMRLAGPMERRQTLVARVEAMVWGMSGLAILIYTAVLVARGVFGMPTPPLVIGAIATVAFLHYAVAFFVTSDLSQQKWLRIPAGGSLVAAVVTGLSADSLWIMPLTSVLTLLLALVPGLILMRAKRTADERL